MCKIELVELVTKFESNNVLFMNTKPCFSCSRSVAADI